MATFAAAVVDEWPCHRRHNLSECNVLSRSDLPTFADDAALEVIALSRPVEGAGGPTVGKLMGFIHSAIGLRELNGTKEMNIEFFALNFSPHGVVIPDISADKVKWSSEAVVAWDAFISSTEWPSHVPLGVTTGKVINRFFDWVPTWHQRHKYYELWSAWNQSELGPNVQRFFDDTTCNTFTEDAIHELYRLGAPLSSDATLCRSYFVFTTDGPLQRVEPGTLENFKMLAYYESLDGLLDKLSKKHIGRETILEIVGTIILEQVKPTAYIYDRESRRYYAVKLKPPHLELWPMYISQRMVLPWQPVAEARSKECDPWAMPVIGSNRTGTDSMIV